MFKKLKTCIESDPKNCFFSFSVQYDKGKNCMSNMLTSQSWIRVTFRVPYGYLTISQVECNKVASAFWKIFRRNVFSIILSGGDIKYHKFGSKWIRSFHFMFYNNEISMQKFKLLINFNVISANCVFHLLQNLHKCHLLSGIYDSDQ